MPLDNENGVNLSLWLPLGLMAISLLGILFIYLLIKRRNIENEGIDKIIDLVKWFVVSVGIVLITSVVNDGFRTRELGMKKLEQENELLLKRLDFFSKYTETILDAAGEEKRDRLAEYFATVSPKGDMQDSWIKYSSIVKGHIQEFKKNKTRIEVLTEKFNNGTITPEERAELSELSAKNSLASQSLTSTPSQEWAIVAGSDSTPEEAQHEVDGIKKEKYPVYMYKKNGRYRTIVKPFLSRDEASNALQDIMTKVTDIRKDSYIINIQGWCDNPEIKIEGNYTYTECK